MHLGQPGVSCGGRSAAAISANVGPTVVLGHLEKSVRIRGFVVNDHDRAHMARGVLQHRFDASDVVAHRDDHRYVGKIRAGSKIGGRVNHPRSKKPAGQPALRLALADGFTRTPSLDEAPSLVAQSHDPYRYTANEKPTAVARQQILVSDNSDAGGGEDLGHGHGSRP